jgi:poly(A) polymerase
MTPLVFLNKLSLYGKAYFVGGVSRDLILNKAIITHDIDITTSAKIDDILNTAHENLSPKKISINEKYGNVRFNHEKYTFDITKSRIDKTSYGRQADIEYTNDFEIDSIRRDFTINAILIDKDMNIFDYHNGVSDLENGIVRFIGNPEERIAQDYTRILRYFRFTALFKNYRHNINLLDIITKNANKLREISPVYIKNEFLKAIFYDNSCQMFETITNLDIDKQIFRCKINQNFAKIITIAKAKNLNAIYPLIAIVNGLSKDDLIRMEISKKYLSEFDKIKDVFHI